MSIVVIRSIIRENRLSRIHAYSLTDGILIGIVVMRKHELTIDIESQVVIQERRIQSKTYRRTLKIRTTKNTVLVRVSDGCTIRHILKTSTYRYIMVCTKSTAIDFILPIGAGTSHEVCCRRAFSIVAIDKTTILICAKHVKRLTTS